MDFLDFLDSWIWEFWILGFMDFGNVGFLDFGLVCFDGFFDVVCLLCLVLVYRLSVHRES